MTTVSSAFVLAVEMYISHSNNVLIKSLRDRALETETKACGTTKTDHGGKKKRKWIKD